MADRPNKITLTETQIKQAEMMAGFGMSEVKISIVLGISPKTLQRRKADQQVFSDAIERGKATAEMAVGRTLFKMATEDKNITAIIWFERTRNGRFEKQQIEHTGNVPAEQKTVVILPSNGRGDEVLGEEDQG